MRNGPDQLCAIASAIFLLACSDGGGGAPPFPGPSDSSGESAQVDAGAPQVGPKPSQPSGCGAEQADASSNVVVVGNGSVINQVGISNAPGCELAGNGQLVSDIPMLSSFSEVLAGPGVPVRVEQGPASVRVTVDENLRALLELKVVDGQLQVTTRDKNVKLAPSRSSEVVVSHPELRQLSAVSGGRLVGTVGSSQPLTLEALSSGYLELTLSAAQQVAATVSASADLVLHGKADFLKVTCTASADLTGDLEARRAEIEASASADVVLHVAEEVQVRASAGAKVTLHGQPAKRDVESAGASVTFAQ